MLMTYPGDQLCDSRVKLLLRHCAKFPPRYRKVVQDFLAHSDDEFDTGKNYYGIKTLHYRSKNASIFMRRLDAEMLKEAETNGKTSRRRVCKSLKKPVLSDFKKAPKTLQ